MSGTPKFTKMPAPAQQQQQDAPATAPPGASGGADGAPPKDTTKGNVVAAPPAQQQQQDAPAPAPPDASGGADGAPPKDTPKGNVAAAPLAPPHDATAALSAPPYDAMLTSTAYGRLRAEHPVEFAPASVFFTHDVRSAIDRRNSFRVKAALVYEKITGQHIDDHMLLANKLLLALARKCHSKILGRQPQVAGAGDSAEVTDELWDAEKKRVVDGIFLVVGFLPKLKEAITSPNADRDSVDQTFKSRHMLDMVTDVIKLENQLRLQDLLNVARNVEDVIRETVGHSDFKDVKDSMGSREYELGVKEQNLADVIHGFCWYYSPFSTKKTTVAPSDSPFQDVAKNDVTAKLTLLDCLHMMSVVKPAQGKGGSVAGRPSRMPTARDLRRSGIRLQASEDGRAMIMFDQPKVLLPALVYDFKLATVALNLLAREYEEQSKPITRYFQMMNEIVEEAADVRILRRAGVVCGGSRGGQEVHDLIKKIDGHASYPSVYMAIDREIDKVREYHDQRMANFFVRNRPGVIWASSVAAVSVAAIVAARRKRG